MYRNSITSSLSAEFPCHVAVEEPYDPLFDEDTMITRMYHPRKSLTFAEKESMVGVRLPAAGVVNVPLPTSQEF